MKRISLTLLFIFILFKSTAQTTSINTTSMPFLLINPDARAGGMGDVGVATSSDAFAIYHNPAKIAFNETQMSIGINYTPWLRNLTNDIFVGGGSFINKITDNASWGVNIKYFSLGEIQLTTDNGTKNGLENPSEFAITGVYSLKLSELFSMGIGLKYINSNYKIKSIDTNLNSVNTFAVDVSGYFQSDEKNYGTFNGRYRFGFNIANIGPKVEYTPGIENFIPTNAKIGSGFDFIFDNSNLLGINIEFNKLLVPSSQSSNKGSLEGIFSSLGDRPFNEELKEIIWSIGAEYQYNNKFALRTGYLHESETKGNRQYFTVGTGFKLKDFSLDLSYLINTSNVNNPLENTLRFSLSFDFGEIYDTY